jgi:hypothetical protein
MQIRPRSVTPSGAPRTTALGTALLAGVCGLAACSTTTPTAIVPAPAPATADPTTTAADPSAPGWDGRIDAGHRVVSRYVGDVADRIDRFFVDQRIDENYDRSRLRLRGGYRVADYGDNEPVFNFRLNLWLPRIEERLSLVLAGARNEDDLRLPDDGDARGDDASGLALRYFFFERAGIQLNIDGGVRWHGGGPDPLIKLRGRRDWYRGKVLLRLTGFPFWSLDEGPGAGARFDVDRRFGTDKLGRWRNEVEYSTDGTEGMEFRSDLFFFQTLDDVTGYRLRLGIKGSTDHSSVVQEARLGFLYRRLIYSNWLYVLLEPMLRFPQEESWNPAPEALVQLEFLFGEQYVESARSTIRETTGLAGPAP